MMEVFPPFPDGTLFEKNAGPGNAGNIKKKMNAAERNEALRRQSDGKRRDR
jgi:hypothetical protein